MVILTGVRWNLSVVLICISFKARDGKHFLMCFLAIWISSFEKVQLSTSLLVHWFWGSLVFWAPCIFWSFVWCIASEHFLLLCGWSLQFKNHFFCCAEAFLFHVVPFVHLSLSYQAAGILLRKSFPTPIAFRVFPALLCINFRVSGVRLRSLIHFELILAHGDTHGTSFSFLQADNHFSQQHLLKRLSIRHHMFLVPLSIARDSELNSQYGPN
jgi:hypothetical protein